MLRGCENQRGSSALQKMIKKQGRLPRSPQEPGPRTKCRAEASLGHRARSPQPEGRRFSPSTEEDPAASPSAAAATRPAGPASAASPPLTTTHHHPAGRGAGPRPPSAGARRARALLLAHFLGVHGQGLSPLGPKPRRRTVCGGREAGHAETASRRHRRRLSSVCTGASGPARSAPSQRARRRRATVARVKGRPAAGRERGAPRACALPPNGSGRGVWGAPRV